MREIAEYSKGMEEANCYYKREGKRLDSEEKPTVHCGGKKEEGKEENE